MSKPKSENPSKQAAQVSKLAVTDIRADDRAQPRTECWDHRVAEYAEDMDAGDKFPPLVVFHDKAGVYWLADGFHRYLAAIGLKWKTIECDVREGELRDAILFSCGTNATHGLSRSYEDKHQAVTKLLMDEEWGKWSDREIARRCHVNHELVGKLRQQLAPVTGGTASEPRTYRTKHGTTATMKTGNVGKGRQPQLTSAQVAEIADRAEATAQRRQAAGNAVDPAESAEQRKDEAEEAEAAAEDVEFEQRVQAEVARRERVPSTLAAWKSDLSSRITRAAFHFPTDKRAELFDYLRHILDVTQRDLDQRDSEKETSQCRPPPAAPSIAATTKTPAEMPDPLDIPAKLRRRAEKPSTMP